MYNNCLFRKRESNGFSGNLTHHNCWCFPSSTFWHRSTIDGCTVKRMNVKFHDGSGLKILLAIRSTLSKNLFVRLPRVNSFL